MIKLFHSRTQHAVGQGGFHTASIDDGSSVFRYAYDCGSTNSNRLVAAIEEMSEGAERLDALFLSHLDQDHANGTDKLLDLVEVDTVFLPYLSPFERLVLALEVVAQPTGMQTVASVLSMLAAPIRWFGERGVRRVVFVKGGPVTGLEGVESGVVLPPPDAAAMKIEIPKLKDPTPEERASLGPHPRNVRAGTIPSQALLINKGNLALWALTPFVYPEPVGGPALQRAVAQRLGIRGTPSEDSTRWLPALKRALADRDTRRDLANLYTTHIRKDRNLSSMTLFSGPVAPPSAMVQQTNSGGPYGYWRPDAGKLSDVRSGWMGTGDAHLDRNNRRTAFEQFYGPVLGRVGTMMLPHHGSKHNLRSGFIQAHGGLIWVAAYGEHNGYHHPDKHLMRVAENYGDAVHVTERRRSEFLEMMSLEW